MPPFSVAILYYQPHIFHTLTVFIAGGNDINSCGVDTAVTENIGKLGNILFNPVKHPCEQMPQIMGKHFLRIYACLLTKPFHLPPDICTAYRFACAGDKYSACLNPLLRHIAEQFLLQLFYKPDLYHFSESGSEEAIEDAFEILERYFENDYAGTYAALLFGADYFDKEDVEYFYNGTKVNAHQMKENVENIMFRNGVSLAALLVDEEDKVICMNLSLRIKMAEEGYISTKDIISDLYDFTYGGVGFRVVSDEKLLEEITYKELTRDIDAAFEGKKVYYDELSPVGKMVFLYIMPRCVVQFDQAAGSELWYHYFMETYESVWDSIIDRDIFENVVQF